MKYNNFLRPFLLVGITTLFFSCKKDYLEQGPSNAVSQTQLLATVEDSKGILNGAIQSLFAFGVGGSTGHDNYGQKSFDCASDLMGTDIVVNSAGFGWYNRDYQYVNWGLATNNSRSDVAWTRYYDLIKRMNNILGIVDNISGSQIERETLKGQALGVRAYAYYYLINYMQQTYKGNESKPGVPIYTESKLLTARNTVADVYAQILSDLKNAETLLANKTVTDKTNISINVIYGFRARVALLMNDWKVAADYANKAYTAGATFQLMTPTLYRDGFAKISNPEWIWGSLIPTAQATIYASFFSHFDVSTGGYAALGGQKKIPKDLYDLIPVGDVRKTMFQQSAALATSPSIYTDPIKQGGTIYSAPSSLSPAYNQVKFRVPVVGSWGADYLLMRAAEMYLIEAEAKARDGNEAGAKTVLENLIKTRYPAYSASSFSGVALVNEILLQRRIELWGEGFSLIDIKRTNKGLNRPTGAGNHGTPNLDPVVFTQPDASPRFLMRIPQRELDNNASLTGADQNP